ncbi:MAG: alpha/beta hydrolase [Acidobacteriaceae bacterium]|nr:alpha/beta hydrolase [Acidobacteriaceae bacterium]
MTTESLANATTNGAVITSHRADVSGIRLYYRSAGTGEAIVLLHGFPETSYAWRKIIPAMARQYRIIAPDLRGFGDSDRPSDGYDKQTVAEDICQLVEQLNLGPINLVGHDVGMMVAYEYAAAHPREVRRLVLMEAALPGLGLEALYDAGKYPRMYHLPLFEAPNGLAEALIVGREEMFISHFMRQQTYNPDGPEEEALNEYARRLSAPGSLHGAIEYFRTHSIDAIRNREHAKTKLKMPVLTIGGTASFGADLEDQIRPLVENLRSVMIDECGHYLAEECPERVVAELMGFFSDGKD